MTSKPNPFEKNKVKDVEDAKGAKEGSKREEFLDRKQMAVKPRVRSDRVNKSRVI